MSSALSQVNDHSIELPSLIEDNEAGRPQRKARSLEDGNPSVGTTGPLRAESQRAVGKDLLAFFILGIIVRTL